MGGPDLRRLRTADLGQGEELEPARAKAELMGVRPEHIFIDDLREEFVRDFVFPMMRANALYEGLYLLGTSIARPLIAKKQIEIAERVMANHTFAEPRCRVRRVSTQPLSSVSSQGRFPKHGWIARSAPPLKAPPMDRLFPHEHLMRMSSSDEVCPRATSCRAWPFACTRPSPWTHARYGKSLM